MEWKPCKSRKQLNVYIRSSVTNYMNFRATLNQAIQIWLKFIEKSINIFVIKLASLYTS
jgi:hypothetical protein